MTRLFIKRRPFFRPSSGRRKPAGSSKNSALGLWALDSVSVFETLRGYRGRVFCFAEHFQRLSDSCRHLGRELSIQSRTLDKWIKKSIRESGWAHCLLRLSVHWHTPARGEFLLLIREFMSHPRVLYEKGVNLRTCVLRRPSPKAQDGRIKSSQFVTGVLAFLEHLGPAAHEFLFLGPDGTVAECSTSNIFVIRGKRLLTPSAASGILRGVTRQVVMGLGQRIGLETEETSLTRHDLYTAEECFLTNTSSEVLPVVLVDARRIGSGRPGSWTRKLAQAFKREVARG